MPTVRLGTGSGSADTAGTLAAPGTELTGCVGSRCVVPAGLGAPLELLFTGLQARTVQERVPSRKVLRLTSNPIPRTLALDRRHLSVVTQLASALPIPLHVVGNRSSFTLGRIHTKPNVCLSVQESVTTDPVASSRSPLRRFPVVGDAAGDPDLTRYRVDLVGVRTAEKNRVDKLLEDACLKLSAVASDIFGVSSRATVPP